MSNIIYLMGAGRSGTTALATFLGNSKEILTVGEMHQFFEHIEECRSCSCGKSLEECEVWSKVLKRLPKDYIENAKEYKEFCDKFEYHSAVPKYFLNRFIPEEMEKYKNINETIFQAIEDEYKPKYILDSAKYIGRYLGLKKSEKLNLKTIYVVRDVRGVINSFSKAVQSPRGALSTIFYWLVVNSVAELLYRGSSKDSMIKLKYESLIDEPIEEFERLEQFLQIDLSDIKNKIKNDDSFDMSHIVGGNRMKANKKIKFQKDIRWREQYSIGKKVLYYLLASPIMALNRFKI
jgi:hypothetical protein